MTTATGTITNVTITPTNANTATSNTTITISNATARNAHISECHYVTTVITVIIVFTTSLTSRVCIVKY